MPECDDLCGFTLRDITSGILIERTYYEENNDICYVDDVCFINSSTDL